MQLRPARRPFQTLVAALASIGACLFAGPIGTRPAHAGDEHPSADAILDRAIAAQGGLAPDAVRDVELEFNGLIREEGQHNIRRIYRYRATDRSFYLHTASKAVATSTERGVLGASGYWERASSREGPGPIVALRRANIEDRKAADGIRAERAEFERMLQMLLLARLKDGKTEVRYAGVGPVTLDQDLPWEADDVLGDRAARETRAYHVLTVEREDGPRLQLFIRASDFVVTKAVQFSRKDPTVAEWFFYFGPFQEHAELGLLLPRFISAHIARPIDERSRNESCKVRGRLTVKLNTGLEDTDLKPAE